MNTRLPDSQSHNVNEEIQSGIQLACLLDCDLILNARRAAPQNTSGARHFHKVRAASVHNMAIV